MYYRLKLKYAILQYDMKLKFIDIFKDDKLVSQSIQ